MSTTKAKKPEKSKRRTTLLSSSPRSSNSPRISSIHMSKKASSKSVPSISLSSNKQSLAIDAEEVFRYAQEGDFLGLQDVLEQDSRAVFLISDRGVTALHYACQVASLETVTVLLEYGADPKMSDASGLTPFHRACSSSSVEFAKVCKLLLERCPQSMAVVCPVSRLTAFISCFPPRDRLLRGSRGSAYSLKIRCDSSLICWVESSFYKHQLTSFPTFSSCSPILEVRLCIS